ncbi:MAG: hypothetical protein AAGB26_12980 [Planctomycetota bacterium]
MIDPQAMTVLGEVPLQHATQLAGTPTSERVYAIGSTQAIGFDPHTLEVDRALHFNEQGVLEGAQHFFHNAVHAFRMHPDNKHLFTTFGPGMGLHRFAIESAGIRYLSSSAARPNDDYSSLAMSHDGMWVAMPFSSTAYVFDANDPETARLAITSEEGISACQFDPVNGKVVAAARIRGGNQVLNIYASTGELDRSYRVPKSSAEICRIEALPIGQRYLVWTGSVIRVLDLQPERILAEIPIEFH